MEGIFKGVFGKPDKSDCVCSIIFFNDEPCWYICLFVDLLIIYSLVEACIVFKKRAAIRCDNLTRFGEYLFAGLRSVIILIPPAVAEACIAMLFVLWAMGSVGYHG